MILHFFIALFGALLADGKWGRYQTIIRFGTMYAIGLTILTCGALLQQVEIYWKRTISFVGLIFVCIGTGGIKPCVSAFGADQVAAQSTSSTTTTTTSTSSSSLSSKNPPLQQNNNNNNNNNIRAFFAYFYFCINLGALTSIFLVPILKEKYGFGYGFLAPTIFIYISLIAFWSKRNEYVHYHHHQHEHQHNQNNNNNNHHQHRQSSSSSSSSSNHLGDMFRLCCILLQKRFKEWWSKQSIVVAVSGNDNDGDGDGRGGGDYQTIHPHQKDDSDHDYRHQYTKTAKTTTTTTSGSSTSTSSREEWSNQQIQDAMQTIEILPVLSMLPVFWMLYDQQGSVWTLQATRMALPYGIQPEQMNVSLFSFFIYLLFFTTVV